MVLPQLAELDSALVISILLSAARIEAPRLDHRARRARDVHVAPCRWNAKRLDAREHPSVANDTTVRIAILEPPPRPRATKPFARRADHVGRFRKARASNRAR